MDQEKSYFKMCIGEVKAIRIWSILTTQAKLYIIQNLLFNANKLTIFALPILLLSTLYVQKIYVIFQRKTETAATEIRAFF